MIDLTPAIDFGIVGANSVATFTGTRMLGGKRVQVKLANEPCLQYHGVEHARVDADAARYQYVVVWSSAARMANPSYPQDLQTPTTDDQVSVPNIENGTPQGLTEVRTLVNALGTSVTYGFLMPVAQPETGAQQ